MPSQKHSYRLRVMADYGSSGIWSIGNIGLFRHSMIQHSKLGLPADLANSFNEWIESYEARINYDAADLILADFDVSTFNQTGLQLAYQLKQFLDTNDYVEFTPMNEDGSLGQAIEIHLDS